MANNTREKLTLTVEQARNMTWGDCEDTFEIASDTIVGKSRWSINHYLVIRRLSDNKFFADTYSVAATECQEERPWSYREPNFEEVFPVEKKVIVYE
jgi:hypothetical protein